MLKFLIMIYIYIYSYTRSHENWESNANYVDVISDRPVGYYVSFVIKFDGLLLKWHIRVHEKNITFPNSPKAFHVSYI